MANMLGGKNMDEQTLRKKLKIMVMTVILLTLCLICTSYALASTIVKIRNNRFVMSMGVELELNNGKTVVDMSDVIFEPGGSYMSEFPIANHSWFDVWYRISFANVEGELKDYVKVKVTEEDGTILCNGLISKLSDDNVFISSLSAYEEKKIRIEFYFLKESSNIQQGKSVIFDIKADATQKQNNSDKDFGD